MRIVLNQDVADEINKVSMHTDRSPSDIVNSILRVIEIKLPTIPKVPIPLGEIHPEKKKETKTK